MCSLRSLCLLEVHSLGQNTLDLSQMAPSLAKDIKIMRLFNRCFIDWEMFLENNLADDRLGIFQNALSIQYDGVSWSIMYRSNDFVTDCCPHCDFVEPDLEQFTLEEGKLSPVPPQFISEDFHQGYKDLMMGISCTLFEDGSGQIKFNLFKDSVPLTDRCNPTITIWMDASNRQWVADCCGFNDDTFADGPYIETPDPIQDVFTTPLYHSCIRRAMMLLQEWLLWEVVGPVGLDEVMAAVDEAFNQQEPEEFLEDFWRLAIVE
eukprot:GFUD01040690.1.p1 GENE.GFUD01040690.1~~GFUD01040690.1.p1  ORF type:complete len:281 (-),score=45.18 GFUD01040690.1:77-865(-)